MNSPDGIDTAAVLGSGVMGHGIALAFALDGHPVALYDVNEDLLAESEDRVRSVLDTLVSAGEVDADEADAAADRITRTTSLPDAVDGADFVTEAVVEDLDIKREVFANLDDHAEADAILATNTSGLSITEIAAATDRPEQVVGTHWFNPPYVVPLVEVIRGEETADEVVETTYDFFDEMGKTPVRVEKDIPGFIGNRIQMAMIYEAFSLLDRGVASAEAIDRAVKAGFGFRLPLLGIFEKVDHSGLDVEHEVEEYLLPDLDRGTESKDVLSEAVENGDYGLKTGKGVYDWSDVDPDDIYDQRDEALLAILDLYDSMDMERTPRK
ncbi:3-hydroxyacyl-CoA dehydrogenase family protein [Haloplanus aerogenes]|uniref:3-hydroxyacyl-CoA dehydrogenase family protein n=1 Tax=Haloplanus aerogenes TaxID=660522 RepID=A0A3M0DSN0_9EURY|nr:3-hydroxyacyl-CoA dehydrogenase family protein [Haloplanus aerogenes]AZH25486.1 3-hydroxyacyl-CoA dehydrogenase family protein [Haloplanus aerogenes]RMB25198.1 3-hydroxybutyryl-CoA dehydrogenase/enoyl-CoA hydratase/3-hydroxyacyl-CoA dehydrogenase [Haloplanus aerogenes]